MKRITALFIALLLIINLAPASSFADEEVGDGQLGWSIDVINATFLDRTVDVKREVMDIDGGMDEPIYFDLDYQSWQEGYTFTLTQMKGGKTKELISGAPKSFSVNVLDFEYDWPVYLNVYDPDGYKGTYPLALRINKPAILSKVPDDVSSEFGAGLKVDMSYLLPGMGLEVLPFLIPVTVRTYSDGSIRMGIGMNSTDVDFWEKAGTGQMPEAQLAKDMKELFYGDPHNLDDIKGESMGVVIIFNGWAEGNVNTNEPIKGEMMLYVGTGFGINGQYGIFTWSLTLQGGADGIFDFSFVYDEQNSKYNFSADTVKLGVKGSVELYGGVGCTLASIGVYGAASIEYQEEMYPDPEVEHLILAGEIGLKAKLFGKTLASFVIISGSHDFVFDDKKKLMTDADIRQFLLENDYGNSQGVVLEAGKDFTWHGEFVDMPTESNEWGHDRDFSHLLATDIYPDSQVQIVDSGGSGVAEMRLVFLGSGSSRANGNSSTLMSSYYSVPTEFVSEPVAIADDGTADYDPYAYGSPDGEVYVVWKNAGAPVSADMTFSEIAETTDIFFIQNYIGSEWYEPEQVTDLAGSGRFATGAKVVVDSAQNPLILYYTNDVNDPAGLAGRHEIFIARRSDDGTWTSEKAAEVTGSINDIDFAEFAGGITVAASWDNGSRRYVTMWRGGSMVWEKNGAAHGQFLDAGQQSVHFTWYNNGSIYIMTQQGNERRFTSEDLFIPDADYEIYGRYTSDTHMIVSRSLMDDSADAFAFITKDDGKTWGRADLTKLNESAYVSHIGAAFTRDNEPVLVYSVQNYKFNGAAAEQAQLLMGEDDARFTDTRADLYISSRKANRHLTIADAKAIDIGSNLPGKPAQVELTIRNTGLYEVDHAYILCDGEVIDEFNGHLGYDETATVIVSVVLPNTEGTEEYEYTFEVTTRETLEPESRATVLISGGYLEADMIHSFALEKESLKYTIYNRGYTTKKARVIVRDEVRDVTLLDKTVKVDVDWKFSSEFEVGSDLFTQEGIENVTMYILDEGQDYDSEGISVNRIKSIVPLDEAYGQAYEVNNNTGHGESGISEKIWIPIVAVVVVAAVIAGIVVYRKRKGKGTNE